MAHDHPPLMVGDRRAAGLFDMKPTEFRKGVALGFFPEPKQVMGMDRWSFEELKAVADGKAARPQEGLEI